MGRCCQKSRICLIGSLEWIALKRIRLFSCMFPAMRYNSRSPVSPAAADRKTFIWKNSCCMKKPYNRHRHCCSIPKKPPYSDNPKRTFQLLPCRSTSVSPPLSRCIEGIRCRNRNPSPNGAFQIDGCTACKDTRKSALSSPCCSLLKSFLIPPEGYGSIMKILPENLRIQS